MKYICETCGSEKETLSKMEEQEKRTLTREEREAFWQEVKYSDSKLVSER